MAEANSTKGSQPDKPYPGFPLGWHRAGYWCKRIRGKLHYFGPRWGTWQEALQEYQRVRDDLHAGRAPRQDADGVTVRYLVNHFLTDRQARLDAGELTHRTFREYKETGKRLVAAFGANRLAADLRPDDFLKLRKELAEGWAPVTWGNEVQRVRTIINYGWQVELLDRPVRFGPSFKKPSRRTMRLHRQQQGKRLFTPQEIGDLLDIAKPQLRCMVLLAVNAGFGNRDCAALPISLIESGSCWLDYPRPKTGVERRVYLWEETRSALEHVLERRKEPKSAEHQHLLFITKYGTPWFSETKTDCPISKEFRKRLDELGIYRRGLSFYAMRHVFETVAGETRDQVAVNHIMGHIDNSMSATCREQISDERLQAVAEHVHGWLWPAEQEGGAA